MQSVTAKASISQWMSEWKKSSVSSSLLSVAAIYFVIQKIFFSNLKEINKINVNCKELKSLVNIFKVLKTYYCNQIEQLEVKWSWYGQRIIYDFS